MIGVEDVFDFCCIVCVFVVEVDYFFEEEFVFQINFIEIFGDCQIVVFYVSVEFGKYYICGVVVFIVYIVVVEIVVVFFVVKKIE